MHSLSPSHTHTMIIETMLKCAVLCYVYYVFFDVVVLPAKLLLNTAFKHTSTETRENCSRTTTRALFSISRMALKVLLPPIHRHSKICQTNTNYLHQIRLEAEQKKKKNGKRSWGKKQKKIRMQTRS